MLKAEPIQQHTLSVLVDNEPGVLARVIGLFSGRGYNIESLTVSETEHEKHLSRITIVTRGTPMVIEQIKNQLDRLVPVHRVVDMTLSGPSIERELAMVKVRGSGEKRVEALRLADAFRARVIDATHRELRVRAHRRDRQDRPVRQPHAAARPGRGLAHRHRGDRARPRGDVTVDEGEFGYTLYIRTGVRHEGQGRQVGQQPRGAGAEAVATNSGWLPARPSTCRGKAISCGSRLLQAPKIPHYRLEDLLAQIKPAQKPPPFEDWSAIEPSWPDDDWSDLAPTDEEWGAVEAGGGGEEWQTTPPRLTPVIFFGSISGRRLGIEQGGRRPAVVLTSRAYNIAIVGTRRLSDYAQAAQLALRGCDCLVDSRYRADSCWSIRSRSSIRRPDCSPASTAVLPVEVPR